MIFVTVGTHEQAFDRLIQGVDELIADGTITEDVLMQIGYSTYEPKHAKWTKVIGYEEMRDLEEKATTIITHGGPATIMAAISSGKSPIVVPRQLQYAEHVNDHQIDFALKVQAAGYPIRLAKTISELKALLQAPAVSAEVSDFQHNQEFMAGFERIISEL
ncbi:MAG: multidrug MFS transporter [Streptococcaceae bacterium]|jgi:UDP-N-acetylglucosamine transferase subunit ALG13|nr:multidrug MFS transporter [Streptococcaceae bacterium]